MTTYEKCMLGLGVIGWSTVIWFLIQIRLDLEFISYQLVSILEFL